MPSYPKVKWNGCTVSAKSMGWRKILRLGKMGLLPYIAGDELRLKVTIRQGRTPIVDDTLHCVEKMSEKPGEATEKEVNKLDIFNNPKQHPSFDIIKPMNPFSHKRGYVIYSQKDAQRRTIMSARIYDSETFMWGTIVLYCGSIVGFMALVVWFLNWLLNCN